FGSEIQALIACPWIPAEPDLTHVAEFLTFGYVPNPRTLYSGIEEVPPASVVAYRPDGASDPRRYWDVAPPLPEAGAKPDRERVAALVAGATSRRMISDVRLGALLSGGIDSSLVLGLMSRASAGPVRTFS